MKAAALALLCLLAFSCGAAWYSLLQKQRFDRCVNNTVYLAQQLLCQSKDLACFDTVRDQHLAVAKDACRQAIEN